MNRIERRIAGTNGARPGAPVCSPGQSNQGGRGMLGSSSRLYQTPQQRIGSNTRNTRSINGIALLQNQGDRISRLEQKLEQFENEYALSTTKIDFKVSKTASKIDLMNGEYKQQMKIMRQYIKELEAKLNDSNITLPIVAAVKKEIQESFNKPPLPPSINQENVTLEIIDN